MKAMVSIFCLIVFGFSAQADILDKIKDGIKKNKGTIKQLTSKSYTSRGTATTRRGGTVDGCYAAACSAADDYAFNDCSQDFGADNCEKQGDCAEIGYESNGKKKARKRRYSCEAKVTYRGSYEGLN